MAACAGMTWPAGRALSTGSRRRATRARVPARNSSPQCPRVGLGVRLTRRHPRQARCAGPHWTVLTDGWVNAVPSRAVKAAGRGGHEVIDEDFLAARCETAEVLLRCGQMRRISLWADLR